VEDIEIGELRLARAEKGFAHYLSVFGQKNEIFNITLPFIFIIESLDTENAVIMTPSNGLAYVSKIWIIDQTTRL
jgi:hypothetical protein